MDSPKLPWAEPRYIDHVVDGNTLRFYQITGFKTLGLKDLIRVIIDNLAQLQRSPREDAGSEEIRDTERIELRDDGKMLFMPKSLTTSKKSAVSTDLATYHDGQRKIAIKLLLDQIMDPRTYKEIVGLIVASLRDEFPTKPTAKEMEEIVESIPLGTFVELIGGVLKANTKVFGPFEAVVLKFMEKMRDRLENLGTIEEDED
jgi:hypothetical protein